MVKVLGICGSPRIAGNTEYFINVALKETEKQGIDTEIISTYISMIKNVEFQFKT